VKKDHIRVMASLEEENIGVFCYITASKIWPYKRGITVMFF
jgi:hypothetical protein